MSVIASSSALQVLSTRFAARFNLPRDIIDKIFGSIDHLFDKPSWTIAAHIATGAARKLHQDCIQCDRWRRSSGLIGDLELIRYGRYIAFYGPAFAGRSSVA